MNPYIISWSIVNNEIDFIKDIIEYHLSLDIFSGFYILDTGSTDGTWEYLDSLNDPKIVVEKYHTNYVPEYNVSWEEMKNPFPEAEVRNHAIQKAKDIFNVRSIQNSWLVQVDGDEIYLPNLKTIIEANPNALSISMSTINPCCELKHHPIEHRRGKNGEMVELHDPHCRVWSGKYNIKYIKNYELKDCNFHCVPILEGNENQRRPHLFETQGNVFVSDISHIHLHWWMGNKLYKFYSNAGMTNLNEIKKQNPLNEVSNLVPEFFLKRREEWYNNMNKKKMYICYGEN